MKESKKSTVARFFKKNGYYILLGVCVVSIALMVTFAVLSATKKPLSVETPPPPEGSLPSDGGTADQDADANEGEGDRDADASGGGNEQDADVPSDPVSKPISFLLPVANCSVTKGYTAAGLAYNQTTGAYSGHMGVDFAAEVGADVVAVLDGTIESVKTTYSDGTTVVIDHGNGLRTVYSSLGSADFATPGAAVKAGDKIGEVSDSAQREIKDGAHLHFACTEEGRYVDPDKYFLFEEK